MRNGEIKDREEGFSVRALIVMSIGGAIVPECFIVAFEIVVGFRSIARVVAGLAEMGDVGSEVGGNGMTAAHVLRAHGGGVDAHEDGGTGDSADGCIRVGGGEAGAARGEGIEIRSLSFVISIAAEPLGGVVLADDPEDIGFIGGERESGEKENEEILDHDFR